MSVPVISFPTARLVQLGLQTAVSIHYQSSAVELLQDAGPQDNKRAAITEAPELTSGPTAHTYVVENATTLGIVEGKETNLPLGESHFLIIHKKVTEYFTSLQSIWINDYYSSADARHRVNIRTVNEDPSAALVAHAVFLRPAEKELDDFKAEWNIYDAPYLRLDPMECGILSDSVAVINFTRKIIFIVGMGYSEVLRKEVFALVKNILPQ